MYAIASASPNKLLSPNTYLLSCDVVGAGLYLAEGALANILADHVVADAAAL